MSTVGAGELRNFVGALVGVHAQKGVFVTTADFTDSAKVRWDRVDSRMEKGI